MANEHGLDTHYFKKNLERILRDIDCYTPDEMQLALFRLAMAAKPLPPLSDLFKRAPDGQIIIGQQ